MPHDEKEAVGTVNFVEKTTAQILTSLDRELTNPLPANFSTYRLMRKQPTIALARSAISAPILAGSWSAEASDELKENEDEAKDRIKFIKDMFDPLRPRIVESGVLGGVDFGSQPNELVYERQNDRVIIGKVKPLLLDITEILVDRLTGAFAGYEQNSINGVNIILEPKYCLHIPFRVEGTDWHGMSLLENARETFNKWNEASQGAERYDAKIAGSHWAVFYPPGQSLLNGILTDNFEVATKMLDKIESSGAIAIPNDVAAFADELSNQNPKWRIEILEDKGSRQPGFTERLNYLDKMLVRSLLMPERAILEGQFGTKAEAGVHADLAVTTVQLWDQMIVSLVNHFAVDRVLEINFGRDQRGSVKLVATPLIDAQITFLQETYAAILSDPNTMAEEFQTINTDSLKDKLSIPKSEEVADAGEGGLPPAGLRLAQRIKMLGVDPDVG